jgi:hypothetical protein
MKCEDSGGEKILLSLQNKIATVADKMPLLQGVGYELAAH